MSVTAPDFPPETVTYVAVSTFGAALIQAMGPWVETNHFAWFLDAIGVAASDYYDLVMDQGADGDPGYAPGYSQLFNVQPSPGEVGYGAPTCPDEDLPYIAQFVGVSIPIGTDPVTARSLVMVEAGLNRGTPSAVIAAAKRNLTGTQSVTLIERTYVDGTPSAGWAGLIMRPEECPSLAAVEAAVSAVKMGGIMMWYLLTDGWTITEMEASQATITALEANFRTLTGLEADQPGV